jgi:hypothetical protein
MNYLRDALIKNKIELTVLKGDDSLSVDKTSPERLTLPNEGRLSGSRRLPSTISSLDNTECLSIELK